MALTQSVQTQIAFKNIFGKSQTDSSRDIVNEPYGININIPSENIWTSRISPTPSVATLDGVTVRVLADLIPVEGSNGHSFFTTWPTNLPNEVDYKIGSSFSYGVGSLVGVTAGDRMMNIISDYYGSDYFAIPYIGSGTDPIEGLDIKRWVYQYNSGIFYQDNVVGSDPSTIHVYPYLGSKIEFPETSDNFRVIASSSTPTSYVSTSVTPNIGTYSTSHLYLVSFDSYNGSGGTYLNIAGLGNYEIRRWLYGAWQQLSSGDLNPNKLYYFTWNTLFFQFGETNPSTFVNSYWGSGETNQTVGSIKPGFSFNGVTTDNMFQNIFFGDQIGDIKTFSLTRPSGIVTDLEVGDNLPASTLTFSWGIDYPFRYFSGTTRIARVGAGNILTGGGINGPYSWVNTATISYTYSTTQTFTIDILRTSSIRAKTSLNVNWVYPIYYGSTTSATVSNASGMTKVLASGSNFTLTIPDSGYKYLYIPASYSSIYSLHTSGMPVAMAGTSNGYTSSDSNQGSFGTTYQSLYYTTLDVGNVFGVTVSYKVFRTENQISSSITVVSKDSL